MVFRLLTGVKGLRAKETHRVIQRAGTDKSNELLYDPVTALQTEYWPIEN